MTSKAVRALREGNPGGTDPARERAVSLMGDNPNPSSRGRAAPKSAALWPASSGVGELGDPGPPMLFSLNVGTPMPISVITSGPHRGDVGSGVGAPGGEAQGTTQHRIVFVVSAHPLIGKKCPPRGSPSSPFGRGILVRIPWPTLRP